MPNFLEQLVAEWYEYQGYFVRRNVKVAKRSKGGHGGELDVVVFHPGERRLIHIEPSMDADKWDEREERYAKKFKIGRETIPELFAAFKPLPQLEQVALFVMGSAKNHTKIGGGSVRMIGDFMTEIRNKIGKQRVDKAAIPEQFTILRSLQFAANYWK
jgi:hypothetical protein